MTYDLLIPAQLTAALLPDLLLMGGAMALMLVAAWRPESAEHQRRVGYGAVGLLLVTLAAVVWMGTRGATATDGAIAVDAFRWVVDGVILVAALGAVALSIEHNDREGITAGESHVLVLLAAAAMMLLAAGRDLMVVFLGIEIMSVAVYVLTGMDRRSPRAAEASLKYFLLGAFATGFLLYGIALVYGATGSTQFAAIAQAIRQHGLGAQPMLWVGTGLLLIGFGFKVAAAPFHMWAPDVYDGAPTPVTAFMAAAVKSAALASFLRLWHESFHFTTERWAYPLWLIAVITMVVGNVVALQQRNVKRMLAYSSIAHTGYLLVAIVAASALGSVAFVFYAIAYTLAIFGAFAVVAAMQGSDGRAPLMDDYQGLWHTRPWLATAMAVFLLALMGFPVFGGVGFFAKWYILQAALESHVGLASLAVVLVLTSVISAGYYLQLVRLMFMKERPAGAVEPAAMGVWTRGVLAVAAVLILGFGLFPSQLVRLSAAGSLTSYPFSPSLGIEVPAPQKAP